MPLGKSFNGTELFVIGRMKGSVQVITTTTTTTGCYGCGKKSPQTWGLKTTRILSPFSSPEVPNQHLWVEVKVLAERAPSEAAGENPSLAFSLSAGSRPSSRQGSLLLPSSHPLLLFWSQMSPSLPPVRTPVITLYLPTESRVISLFQAPHCNHTFKVPCKGTVTGGPSSPSHSSVSFSLNSELNTDKGH